MTSFFRDNPTIAFGLGLPLLVVTVFPLASGIPSFLVPGPQYNVLFATGYYNQRSGIQIAVVDQRVQVVYQGDKHGDAEPQIWQYNSRTGAVQEIPIVLPAGLSLVSNDEDNADTELKITTINMPELESLQVDSSSIAPDGYEFSLGNSRYDGDFFSGLFYASRYRQAGILRKSGRNIRLPNPKGQSYHHQSQFIGWVVPQ